MPYYQEYLQRFEINLESNTSENYKWLMNNMSIIVNILNKILKSYFNVPNSELTTFIYQKDNTFKTRIVYQNVACFNDVKNKIYNQFITNKFIADHVILCHKLNYY